MCRRTSSLASLGALLCILGVPRAAVAEEDAPRAVVVPVLVEDQVAEGAEVFARAELIRQSDRGLFLSAEEATERFEEEAGADPPELEAREIDQWLKHGRDAMQFLARSDYERAAESLRKAQRVSERAAEALNRETAMARKVLDTCLFLVRSLWETNQHARAEVQARKCRQLVPSIDPTMALHTPEVRTVLRRIDERRENGGSVTLRVVSPKSGCVVRLNGLHLGETPFELSGLVPGEYRVQVECEQETRGRVHRVLLDKDRVVRIDPTLDQAAHVDEELYLDYRSVEAFSKHIGRHGQALAQSLGVEDALLVSTHQLIRVHAETGLIGSEALRSQTDLARAAQTLLRQDVPKPTSRSAATPAHNTKVDGPATTKGRRIAGGVLVGTGVAALGASWGLYARRVRKGDAFSSLSLGDEGFVEARNEWEDARLPFLLTASLGGALLASGFALAYAPRKKLRWWVWATGAIGTGLTAWGIAEMARADTCPRDFEVTPACVPGQRSVDRGVILITTGAPLFFFPIWGLGKRRSVRVDARGTGLFVKGRF